MSHLLFTFISELSSVALECILREWSLITREEGRGGPANLGGGLRFLGSHLGRAEFFWTHVHLGRVTNIWAHVLKMKLPFIYHSSFIIKCMLHLGSVPKRRVFSACWMLLLLGAFSRLTTCPTGMVNLQRAFCSIFKAWTQNNFLNVHRLYY